MWRRNIGNICERFSSGEEWGRIVLRGSYFRMRGNREFLYAKLFQQRGIKFDDAKGGNHVGRSGIWGKLREEEIQHPCGRTNLSKANKILPP